MTFLAPLFLLGVLAAGVPVLLHLVHRKTAKELPFATLRFLRQSVERTRRRRRVQDFLLLLVRAAALVLVAVGLARPTITRLGMLWGPGGSAVVIVLDNSASMGQVDRDVVRFETARAAATQILDELGDGDRVALLLTGGPLFEHQNTLDRTHERVRQTLAAAQPSYQRADLVAALARARKILAGDDAADKQIYIISDRQALSWDTGERGGGGPGKEILRSAQNDANVAQNDANVAQNDGSVAQNDGSVAQNDRGVARDENVDEDAAAIPVIIIDCNRAPKPNVAVERADVDAPLPITGIPLKLAAGLRNAAQVAQQRRVDLYLDGVKLSSSPELDLAANGRAVHEFLFTLDRGGVHEGEVRLVGEDGSPLDDRRFFTLTLDPGIPVAIVKPRRHETAYLEDTFYVENALAPGHAPGAAVRPTVLLADELIGEPLSQYRIVFCVNLPALEPEAAGRLGDYVAHGGNLIWFCGDRVDPTGYNRMNEAAGGRILPAPLLEVRSADAVAGRDAWHVAMLDRTHPALEPLAEPAALYESILVYRHVQVDASRPGVRVLARLDDGQPLLVERAVERGRVLFWATGAHVDWTNAPLRPIFLPLLVRLSFALAGAPLERNETLAGAPLMLAWDGPGAPAAVEVRTPTGQTLRLPTVPTPDGAGRALRLAETYEVGVYRFRPIEGAGGGPLACAVNVDPDESDPATISPEALRVHLGGAPVIFAENPDDLSSTFAELRQGRSLWDLFLAAVLVALVLESYLANRFTPKQA